MYIICSFWAIRCFLEARWHSFTCINVYTLCLLWRTALRFLLLLLLLPQTESNCRGGCATLHDSRLPYLKLLLRALECYHNCIRKLLWAIELFDTHLNTTSSSPPPPPQSAPMICPTSPPHWMGGVHVVFAFECAILRALECYHTIIDRK